LLPVRTKITLNSGRRSSKTSWIVCLRVSTTGTLENSDDADAIERWTESSIIRDHIDMGFCYIAELVDYGFMNSKRRCMSLVTVLLS
jgi:hypothetical protein